MEILIGIPFGIVGALIFIAGYSDRLRDDPLPAYIVVVEHKAPLAKMVVKS